MRALGFFVIALLLAGCDGEVHAVPGQPALLDRAIAAAGGAERLASIRAIEARSRGEQLGRAYQVTVQRLLPDLYRHDVEVSDARLVQATDGAEIWATLDDYPIPVTPEEADSLRESWRLGQASMLYPLQSIPGIKIRQDAGDETGEVLRVTFPEDPKFPGTPQKPYALVFDRVQLLLRRIEFDAMIFGNKREGQTRIELLDYRNVEGVMIPFGAKISVNGNLEQEERVEQVLINPAISPDLFRKPPAPTDLVIKKRTSPEATVALLEQHGDKPDAEEAEETLNRYAKKHDLARNGPLFRLQPVGDSSLPAVGMPIAPPPATTRPSSRPTTRELPRIAVLPSRTILTTTISGTTPASRPAAIERLLTRAREDGLEPDGPCKIVLWSADVVQLQLPVRPRKG
jgi:hypothetical protein